MSKPLRVAPGASWDPFAAPAAIEPADKIAAMKAIASGLPAGVPYAAWFARGVAQWAASTGSSLESVLGLKRSGIPTPHQVAHQASRDDAIRCIARGLPGRTTEKAHRLAAIIRGEASAPSRVALEVKNLFAKFGDDVPRSAATYFRIIRRGD